MSPWTEAKAWALREVWRESHQTDYGLLTYVAGKLKKKGGGKPTKEAVRRLFEKMDDDAEWYPGKYYGEPPGRPSAISERTRESLPAASWPSRRAMWSLPMPWRWPSVPCKQKCKNHTVCLAKRAPWTPPEVTYQRVGVGKSEGNRGEIEGNQSQKKEIRVLAQCNASCFPT